MFAVPYIIAGAAAMSAVSAIRQGQAAKAAGDYNATINTQNAQIAHQETVDQQRQQDRENYLRLGSIRAAQGHAGGTEAGSVLDVIADTAAQGELERQQIAYQGDLKARGFTNTAALDSFGGNTAQSASYMKAGSELLAGGANAAYVNTKLKRN